MDIADYETRLSARAFLEIDFGERIKAELDDGEIRTLVRGPVKRVRIAGNLLYRIMAGTDGQDLQAYTGSLALMTGQCSVRFPDVAVYDHDEVAHHFGDRDLMRDPIVAAHVLADPYREMRLIAEYRQIDTLRSLILVNHEQETVRHLHRATTNNPWTDEIVTDLHLPSLALTIPHTEIFARD